jgi:hypothetical protein
MIILYTCAAIGIECGQRLTRANEERQVMIMEREHILSDKQRIHDEQYGKCETYDLGIESANLKITAVCC